jgi:hypothetical protein
VTSIVAVIAVLSMISGAIGIIQPVSAAQNLHEGNTDPGTVNESAKVKHTISYQVDNVSNDGSSDELFVTFPNAVNVSAGALSSFSGNVTNTETGASVSISSSPSIVDGPDGDGIKETIKIGVQPEGEAAAIDLTVNFTGYVTWPAVTGDTEYGIDGAVTDSKFADAGPVEVTSVLVQDTSTNDDTDGGGNDTNDGSGSANLAVSIDSTTAATAGDDVEVTTTVTNVGNTAGTQTISLSADGTQVDSTSVSLAAGSSTEVLLSWSTESGDAGSHTLTVAPANATTSTSVTVESTVESLAGSDNEFDIGEVRTAIQLWASGDLSISEVRTVIQLWATGQMV